MALASKSKHYFITFWILITQDKYYKHNYYKVRYYTNRICLQQEVEEECACVFECLKWEAVPYHQIQNNNRDKLIPGQI